MKIKTIANSAIALSLAGLSSVALAEPTVYGKANVSLNKFDSETGSTTDKDNWELKSNASRLGVKGKKKIDDNLKAVYKLEYQVAIDDGKAQTSKKAVDEDGDEVSISSTFKQRNIYVGLQGDFGQVIAGKFDTPTKKAQGKIDRFNDLPLGDIKNVLMGENRTNNTIQYKSPEFNGFTAKLALIPGEDSGKAGDDENNGPADSTSISIKYKADNFWIALANDTDMADESIATETDVVYSGTRLAGEYNFGDTKVGALVQSGEDSDLDAEATGYMISAQHKMGKWIAKGQYAASTEEMGAAEEDIAMVTLGADYKLNKKVKLYGYASNWTLDKADVTKQTVGFGTEVKF